MIHTAANKICRLKRFYRTPLSGGLLLHHICTESIYYSDADDKIFENRFIVCKHLEKHRCKCMQTRMPPKTNESPSHAWPLLESLPSDHSDLAILFKIYIRRYPLCCCMWVGRFQEA